MTTQQVIKRRRHAISTLLGAGAVLAALVVVPMVAGAGARDFVTIEKACAAQPNGAPMFTLKNTTNADIVVTVANRYTLGGQATQSFTITVPANGSVVADTEVPATWPLVANWGPNDVDHKYYAHFTLNGKAMKAPEFCNCNGAAASTTTSTFRT